MKPKKIQQKSKVKKPIVKTTRSHLKDGTPFTTVETLNINPVGHGLTPKEIEDNPLNRKVEDIVTYWKDRADDAEEALSKALDKIQVLEKGQLLTADQAAPMEVQKMREKINRLEEQLMPFRYEFLYQGALLAVMCRPRVRECIPISQ